MVPPAAAEISTVRFSDAASLWWQSIALQLRDHVISRKRTSQEEN